MNILTRIKIALIIVSCLLTILSKGQSIPIGTPILEDLYRRAQLLGQVDSSISFTSRPLFIVAPLKITNNYDPTQTLDRELKTTFNGTTNFWDKKGLLQLLPINWQQQFNTHHPYSLNDGSMIPARGYQSMISGGLYAKTGIFSIQLRPEVVFAANKTFETFTDHKTNQQLINYYKFKNIIDLPEYFPGKPYKKLFWGQSSLRMTIGSISAGISSENMWWGPGMRNSLLMTNSAAGFNHFTLNTVKPIRTPIGSFEGQIIGGRLDQSGFFGADTNLVINGVKLYHAKREDWRYINGIVMTYQPRWVPGLFLGLTRSFIIYHNDMNGIGDYFPVFTPLTKKSNYGESDSKVPGDQRASVFIRWLLQKEHIELYFEYGREDHSYDLRDLTLQLDHSSAYICGFSKLFPLNTSGDRYIQFNFELIQLETNMTNSRENLYFWYTHQAGIPQGYTNKGQMLGAGIGPGSSMQTTTVKWGKGLKSLGFQIERYVHNNDLFYLAIKDIRSHWVDINVAAIGEYNYQNLLFSAKLELIRSMNYQYNYEADPFKFWTPGHDVYNLQANIGISYRF